MRDGFGAGYIAAKLLAGGLELDEELEVAAVVALGGIDAPLDLEERLAEIPLRFAEGVGFPVIELHGARPHGGLGVGGAFEAPGVADHGGEEDVLVGVGGLELVEVAGAEGFEEGGVFAGDDGVGGEQAVFEGVETGDGLAGGGAGSSGFLRVEAIGLDLFKSAHTDLSVAGGLGGRRAWEG